MLVLTDKDLEQLNAFIQEMPLKHGLPLLNFLNAKLVEQAKAVQKEEAPEEKPEE